eukprot:6067528-Prymnesium_polylepis.1
MSGAKDGMTVKLSSSRFCAEKAAPSKSWEVSVSDESSNVQPSQYSLFVSAVSPAASLACPTPASFGGC